VLSFACPSIPPGRAGESSDHWRLPTHTERDASMANDFTLSQRESHLWEAANILRGPVDAADFKKSVFPLLPLTLEAS